MLLCYPGCGSLEYACHDWFSGYFGCISETNMCDGVINCMHTLDEDFCLSGRCFMYVILMKIYYFNKLLLNITCNYVIRSNLKSRKFPTLLYLEILKHIFFITCQHVRQNI